MNNEVAKKIKVLTVQLTKSAKKNPQAIGAMIVQQQESERNNCGLQ
jgi:hypothetical protein